MSRGPGRWQRAVLDACERTDPDGYPDWVSIQDVAVSVDPVHKLDFGQHLDRSTREAIRRAMRTLERAGRVECDTDRRRIPVVRRWEKWCEIDECVDNWIFESKRREDREVLCARRPFTPEQSARLQVETQQALLAAEAIITRRMNR